MAYDLEEQEQLDTLKAWWKQYGNQVTWLLVVALSAYAALTGWDAYQRDQSTQASQLYEKLQKSVVAKDNVKVQRAASDLVEKFSRTSYASMAALSAARSAFEGNDLKTAKMHLHWVIDQGIVAEYKILAKIRLAGIALDEKAYDDALLMLAGDFPSEFAADVADRKGDVYMAQNKISEARMSYQSALEKLTDKNPGHQLIQIKLDAIGGALGNKVAANVTNK